MEEKCCYKYNWRDVTQVVTNMYEATKRKTNEKGIS